MKPYFNNEGLRSNTYFLLEKDVSISKEREIAKMFNEYLVNVASTLKLRYWLNSSSKCNTLDELNKKLKFHSSILKIKENFEFLDKFIFKTIATDELRKVILNLDDSEATQSRDIPTKIVKESIDIYLVELNNILNSSFKKGCFPEQ